MVKYSSIMPTFTSSDSTSKNTLQGWQKQGAWGFFDETETGIQEKEERPKPKFDLTSSINFNIVAEKTVNMAKTSVVDAFGEAFNLGKFILTGDNEAIGVPTETGIAENVASNAPIKEQQQDNEQPKDSPLIQEIILWLNELKQAQSIEEYKNRANNAMRLLDGTPSGEETAGFMDKESIATLISVAKKRIEIKEKIDDQDKNQSMKETSPGKPGENDLINKEGGAGSYSTVGDASVG